jgi:hypothetical protein
MNLTVKKIKETKIETNRVNGKRKWFWKKYYKLLSSKHKFKEWLIRENYSNFKWVITTLFFVVLNLIGWILNFYYKCK